MPTREKLREIFDYDPQTGRLIHKKLNRPIGWKVKGYWMVYVERKIQSAHRVIWKFFNGEIPVNFEIDHINHNTLDNKIENLRCVTKIDNHRNRTLSPKNKSGVCGVRERDGRWYATIKIERKGVHIGSFSSFEDAVVARRNAEIQYGFHPNHGKMLVAN